MRALVLIEGVHQN